LVRLALTLRTLAAQTRPLAHVGVIYMASTSKKEGEAMGKRSRPNKFDQQARSEF
jgi:hypothetical protein